MNPLNKLDSYIPELKFAHNVFSPKTCGSLNFISDSWGSFVASLPHSPLLTCGEPFTSYFANKHLYFVHFTRNYDAIRSSGKLLSSPGNLVNVVYCIPAIKNIDNSFSFHNYGFNVFKHLSALEYDQLHPLLIEVNLTSERKTAVVGVNYLKLGPVYWKAFNSCPAPPIALLQQIEEKYNYSMTLLAKLNPWLKPGRQQIKYVKSLDDARMIINIVSEISASEPLFSFFYLEAISIGLMYSSNDPVTLSLLKMNETNNNLYIKAVYELTNQPGRMFAAHTFRPTYEKLRQFLSREVSDNHLCLDLDSFIINVVNILLNYFNSWLINSGFEKDGQNLSLLGQVASLAVYFNQQKYPVFTESVRNKLTTIVHNYWNEKHSAIVVNSCTPKGEVGINPADTKLKYRIYNCKLDSSRKKLLLLSEMKAQISTN